MFPPTCTSQYYVFAATRMSQYYVFAATRMSQYYVFAATRTSQYYVFAATRTSQYYVLHPVWPPCMSQYYVFAATRMSQYYVLPKGEGDQGFSSNRYCAKRPASFWSISPSSKAWLIRFCCLRFAFLAWTTKSKCG